MCVCVCVCVDLRSNRKGIKNKKDRKEFHLSDLRSMVHLARGSEQKLNCDVFLINM